MRSPMLVRLLAAAVFASAVTLATAQTSQNFTRVYGVSDRDVPTPVHSTKTITDASALQSLIDFAKSSGITGWKGMVADGTIVFANDPQSYPAHLSVLGSDNYRLDVQKTAGKQSQIFHGARAIFQPVTGEPSSLSSDVSSLGLLAFPRLLSPDYPRKTSVLTDGGLVSIQGKSVHRITLDDPSSDGTGAPWKTTDLYFDPATGRLVESTAYVHLSSADRALYMLDTTYADYRAVGSGTLPYSYTRSLNGQSQWTLQLTSIDLSSTPDISLFQF